MATLTALLPVFALIAIGFALRRSGFLDAAFWAPAERLTYYLLFPALLVHNLALAEFAGAAMGAAAAVIVLATLTVSFLALSLRPLLTADGPGFTSVFQGAIRFNTYVGLAAAAALYGAPGLTLAVVLMALMVPLGNVLCIAVLARYAGNGGGAGGIAWAILGNPLILASAAGALLNVAGIGLPWVSEPILRILGAASLPIGLLAVGAALAPDELGGSKRPVLVSAALKLIALPLAGAAFARVLGLDKAGAAVAVLMLALPAAPSAYIMARQLGGDHRLMAAILTAETLLAAATLPLVLTLLT